MAGCMHKCNVVLSRHKTRTITTVYIYIYILSIFIFPLLQTVLTRTRRKQHSMSCRRASASASAYKGVFRAFHLESNRWWGGQRPSRRLRKLGSKKYVFVRPPGRSSEVQHWVRAWTDHVAFEKDLRKHDALLHVDHVNTFIMLL